MGLRGLWTCVQIEGGSRYETNTLDHGLCTLYKYKSSVYVWALGWVQMNAEIKPYCLGEADQLVTFVFHACRLSVS